MKQLILKMLRKFGYDLVKLESKPFVSKTNIKPLYVEFVGVPGVGKTTMYNALMKQYPQIGISLNQFKRTLNNFSHVKFRDSAFESDLFYQNIADRKLNNIVNNDFKPFDKIRVLQYFYSVMLNDKIINDFNYSYVIIMEEGLMHNFSTELKEIFLTDENNNFEFKNRIIIHCYSSAEKVAHQILKRASEGGHLLPQHKNKSLEDLIISQGLALENKMQFIELLKSKNVSVLDINTSDSTQENIDLIMQFIDNKNNI